MNSSFVFFIALVRLKQDDESRFFPTFTTFVWNAVCSTNFLHQQSCAFPKLQSFVAVCKQINQEQFCNYTLSGISWWMTITYIRNFFQLLLVISYDSRNFLRHFYFSTSNTCVLTSSHYHNTGNDTNATSAWSCKCHAHKPQVTLYQPPPLVLLAC